MWSPWNGIYEENERTKRGQRTSHDYFGKFSEIDKIRRFDSFRRIHTFRRIGAFRIVVSFREFNKLQRIENLIDSRKILKFFFSNYHRAKNQRQVRFKLSRSQVWSVKHHKWSSQKCALMKTVISLSTKAHFMSRKKMQGKNSNTKLVINNV